MIICSCNVVSEQQVRSKLADATQRMRISQIYDCLGCSAECGRCARTIKTIIDDALGDCAQACYAGCPHGHTSEDVPQEQEFGLAAS